MDDIVLAEGERREEVRLSPDEAAALRACDLLEVAPGWTAGAYSLTARSLVGHVALPARRVVVRPKVPLRNVFAMLAQVAGRVKTAPDEAALDTGESILAGIADLYARTLDELLGHGEARAWANVTAESPFVRGRLLLGPTLRQTPARRHRPVTRRSEWSANTLVNQLLKQAARALLGLDTPGDTQARLERAVFGLADVADTDHAPDTFDGVHLTRQNADARPALVLARWVILGCAPSLAPGPHPFPAFRLDLARLFEEFVAAVLKETLASGGLSVAVQPLLPLDEADEVPLRPDVVIRCDGKTRLVLDTKYKLPGPPRPDDLYQILAYCHALGAPVGGLVFPATTAIRPLVVRQTGVTVYALGLDLGAPPDRFPEACAALAEMVQALVGG